MQLRKLQHVLHQKKDMSGAHDMLYRLGLYLAGRPTMLSLGRGAIVGGALLVPRLSAYCRDRGIDINHNLLSRVDSWSRRFGPTADLDDVLRALEQERGGRQASPPPPTPPDEKPEQAELRQDIQTAAAEIQRLAAAVAAQRQALTEIAPKIKQIREQTRNLEKPRRRAAMRTVKKHRSSLRRQHEYGKRMLREQQQQLEQLLQALADMDDSEPPMPVPGQTTSAGRKKPKGPFGPDVGFACKPSRRANRSIAKAQAKLHAAPKWLRAETAELINRLVQCGTAGGQVAPIPRYDKPKLVKRFLSRRPLPNALQEETATGRPVTLFLPDISPSCSKQAQIACDISNAAGYAGVRGSDVLVFPHSNGCVSESPSYLPWINGKPLTGDTKNLTALFAAVVTGQSAWRITAVVAVGDHDAMLLYEQLASQSAIRRLVWLHNDQNSRDRGPTLAPRALPPTADSAAEKKTRLVYGCTNQATILRGFRLAVQ